MDSSGEKFNPQPTRFEFQVVSVSGLLEWSKIWPDFGWNIAGSRQIWSDLTRSGQYFPISIKIGPRSWWIWPKSAYIIGLKSLDLPVFGWVCDFLRGKNSSSGWSGSLVFSNSQPTTRTDGLGSLHQRPASDRNQALIGRFRVKMIGFRAVYWVRAGDNHIVLA